MKLSIAGVAEMFMVVFVWGIVAVMAFLSGLCLGAVIDRWVL